MKLIREIKDRNGDPVTITIKAPGFIDLRSAGEAFEAFRRNEQLEEFGLPEPKLTPEMPVVKPPKKGCNKPDTDEVRALIDEALLMHEDKLADKIAEAVFNRTYGRNHGR